MTAPALTPGTLAAARWLAGLTADSLAGVDDQASLAGLRPLPGGLEPALELDGRPVSAAELGDGALLAIRTLVWKLAWRTGRTPLKVALDLGEVLDRHVPTAGP